MINLHAKEKGSRRAAKRSPMCEQMNWAMVIINLDCSAALILASASHACSYLVLCFFQFRDIWPLDIRGYEEHRIIDPRESQIIFGEEPWNLNVNVESLLSFTNVGTEAVHNVFIGLEPFFEGVADFVPGLVKGSVVFMEGFFDRGFGKGLWWRI
jgi:hypothetical protein